MRLDFLLYIVVAAVFGWFLFNYVQNSEGSGDTSVYGYTASIKRDAKSHSVDSNGQSILDFTNTPKELQVEIWKRSPLREEFMDLLPNFSAMSDFANDRIIGDDFRQKLLKITEQVEGEFYSGDITQREAKERLDML